MKKLFLCLFIAFWMTPSIAQFFFIGDKGYPATKTEIFKYRLYITFAKQPAQNLMILGYEGCNDSCHVVLRGRAIIYFVDSTAFTLTDNGLYDCVDNNGTTIYYLTVSQIEKLKTTRIERIRYTLKSDCNGAYSADHGGDFTTEISDISYYFVNKIKAFFKE